MDRRLFTLTLDVNDMGLLIASARAAAVAAGYSPAEAQRLIRDADVHAALNWLLVPSADCVPGVDIVDAVSGGG